ncbi:MAG: alpha/beta hydrolase [Limnobacter sp.]|uniref:alpha/beta hydrolase n=1 Tax=Limnobacter sp. TaxID=2003368 RepID=UPI00391D711E
MPSKHTFLICTRDIDENGVFLDEPGNTTYLKVPAEKREYSSRDAISKERWTRAVVAAADGEEDEITGSTGDILFFVHGYNNDIKTVLWRTRVLQDSLAAQGWNGLVVGFDWPSANSTLNYLEDRYDASRVSHRLVEEGLQIVVDAQFPVDPKVSSCTINLHLLGHSTGAYVIMEAFANASKKGELFRKPWRIAQVAFIGADVSSEALNFNSDWAAPMYERIFRLTNYSNKFDKVLGVSNMKRLGTSPRAGRIGLPLEIPAKAVNVDCSEYFKTKDPAQSKFTGTFNHSWHIGDPVFALDLALTLEGDIDREAIPTRRHDQGNLHLLAGQSRPEYQVGWNEDRSVTD